MLNLLGRVFAIENDDLIHPIPGVQRCGNRSHCGDVERGFAIALGPVNVAIALPSVSTTFLTLSTNM